MERVRFIPEEDVAIELRNLAAQVLAEAAQENDVTAPRIQWTTGGPLGAFHPRDAAYITVRVDLDWQDLVATIAHEIRHASNQRFGAQMSVDQDEDDAHQYGLDYLERFTKRVEGIWQ